MLGGKYMENLLELSFDCFYSLSEWGRDHQLEEKAWEEVIGLEGGGEDKVRMKLSGRVGMLMG